MNTPKILGLALSTLLLGTARPAVAQTILINPMTPGISISMTASWGYSILVGASNLSVTEMGYFTTSSSELAAHAMGIWDNAGNMIASATAPAGTDPLRVGDFNYVNITPVTLLAGGTYTIAAATTAGSDPALLTATGTFNGATVVKGGLLTVSGSALVDPTTNEAGTQYYQVNLITASAPVPEPGTYALIFGAAGLALAYSRRRLARSRNPVIGNLEIT